VSFEEKIRAAIDLIGGRLGLPISPYLTPEGRREMENIRILLRRRAITEEIARERLKELRVPVALIDTIIKEELGRT